MIKRMHRAAKPPPLYKSAVRSVAIIDVKKIVVASALDLSQAILHWAIGPTRKPVAAKETRFPRLYISANCVGLNTLKVEPREIIHPIAKHIPKPYIRCVRVNEHWASQAACSGLCPVTAAVIEVRVGALAEPVVEAELAWDVELLPKKLPNVEVVAAELVGWGAGAGVWEGVEKKEEKEEEEEEGAAAAVDDDEVALLLAPSRGAKPFPNILVLQRRI